MTVEQDAIEAAWRGVRNAIARGDYIELDAGQYIHNTLIFDPSYHRPESNQEGFGGLIEGARD